ncbi:gliding motility-associated C-terminal domain-containing protein [Flavobacterium sp. ZB4P13]|uniref:Ig-like domain-containing protein n=1 Tax=Flavobacterium sp. ZB4P13 TaxID=3401728 RepID=UPI003AAE70AC
MKSIFTYSTKLFALFLVSFLSFPTVTLAQSTVTTDKLDYSPGQTVIITGTNWQPGETVKLTLIETPLIHPEEYLYATADGAGNIYNNEYIIQLHDVGQSFTLTATGLTSGYSAQTFFTDSYGPGVAPVNPPTGGFSIDGNLQANTPILGEGDWVAGPTGSGGFVLDNAGIPLVSGTTFHLTDKFNEAENNFSGGLKVNDNPNMETWVTNTTSDKTDMNNGLMHFSKDANGHQWVIVAADRLSNNGTAYIDFEFLQNTLNITGGPTSGGFSSSGPDGGRTVNDFILTLLLTNGGSTSGFFISRWESVPGGYDYIDRTSSTPLGSVYASVNTADGTPVPFGAFGNSTYVKNTFAEAAIDLTALLGAIDPCTSLGIKTIFIKTKVSASSSAGIADFITPLQVILKLGVTDAGLDQTKCSAGASTDFPLNGITTPSPGDAIVSTTWSVVSGSATITNPNSLTTAIAHVTSSSATIRLTVITQKGCSVTDDVVLTVTPVTAAPITGGNQTVCQASPIQTLTATATVPAGQSIVWYDATTGGNIVAAPTLNTVGTVTYYAQAIDNTSSSCPSLTRTAVTLTINPAPIAPTTGGNQTVCQASPIQTLTATATVPAGHSIVWYDAPTGGNIVAAPTLNTVGTVTYYAQAVNNTSTCPSLTRTAVTLTINPAPTAPITGNDQVECETSPIQTLTATATVPAGQSIVWYDAVTGGNIVAAPTLSAVGTVTYYAQASNNTTSCSSLTRTTVSLTINSAPIAPITGGNQTVCQASPIQNLTAMATVPAGQSIVWYDAATGGNIVADPTLNTVGTVTYYAQAVNNTTSCSSLTRTAVSLTINPTPIAPITGSNQTVCQASPIQTLTAMATVPAGQSIVWYDAATGGNIVVTPTLSAVGTVTYYAQASNNTTSCSSLTRTAVSLTINPAPIAPITGGNQTVCQASPIQNLTAMATVPAGQSIVWYDAPTGGNIVADPTLNTVGTVTYYAQAVNNTTSCSSLTRTSVSLTITPAPIAPITGGNQTVCQASPIQTLTATATVPAGQSIVWYDAVTGGNIVAVPTLSAVGTVTYYAQAVNNTTSCPSLTRTAVSLTINPAPIAPITGNDQVECETSPIQTLTAMATVPAGHSIVWYDAPTGGNIIAEPTLSAVGTVTYYAQASNNTNSCSSLTRTAITLTINPVPIAPITGSNQTVCQASPIQTLTAMATVPAGQSIVWYDAATGGNIVVTPTLSALGTVTYYAQAVNNTTSCPSLTRTAVSLTINPAPIAPITGNDQVECETSPIQTLTATATVPEGQSIVWYDAPIGGNIIADPTLSAVGTVTYYAQASNNTTSCPSLTRTAVSLTINPAPIAPITGNYQVECETSPIQTLTATATVPEGHAIVWYDAATDGNIVADPTLSAVDTVTYYAQAVNNTTSCSSLTRTAVSLTINPAPIVPTTGGNQIMCEASPIQTLTATATVPEGQSIVWYDAATDGNIVADPTLNTVGTVTYYAQAVNNTISCSSLTRTAVSLTINTCSIVVTKDGTYVDNNGDGITNIGDTITYAFVVTNKGNVPLTNVTIADLFGDVTTTGGPITLDVDASNSTAFIATYAIIQADIDTGFVYNSAEVTGTPPTGENVKSLSTDPTPCTSCPLDPQCLNCTITPLTQTPKIALVKTGVFDDMNNDSFAQVGEKINYTFAVTNTGNVTVTNIVITDPSMTLKDLIITGNPIASLAPGATGSVTVVYTISQTDIDMGKVTNSALATGQNPNGGDVMDTSGTTADNDTPTVTPLPQNPKIALVKTGVFSDTNNDGFAQVGEKINYTFAVTNTGNVTVTNIVITDPSMTLKDLIITGNPIASLAPGATSSVTGVYTITQTDIDLGKVTNSALAVGQDPNGGDVKDTSGTTADNDTPTVTPLTQTPGIALVKTGVFSDTNNDGFAQVGEKINYTFAVTNTGNATVTNIVITDSPLIPLVGLTITGNPIASLAPGATSSVTGVYTITQTDIDMGKVTNSALATGQNPNGGDVKDISGTTVDNDTDTVTTLPQNPGLEVIKTAITPYYSSIGDIINYTIQVKNTGNVTLHQIVVTDPLTGLNTTIQSLASGSSQVFNQSYTVTQSDRVNGSVTNTATAVGLTPNGTSTPPASDEAVVEAQIVLGCGTVTVHNAFSPNGDGINELFIIDNIEDILCYPDNTVEIYNRWGVLVFETRGYDNVTKVFRGISEGRTTISQSSGLPTGTYFYILSYNSLDENDIIQTNKKDGYLYLTR